MAVYTFYPCQADGGSVALRAFELASDEDAVARARTLLNEYPSCAYVAVWDDNRPVATCPQDAPGRAARAHAGAVR